MADMKITDNNDKACWNAIGVWAANTPSCPKLKDVVHCANCDVFVSKGRALFDLEPSTDYLREWTDLLAEARLDSSEGAESVLIFRLEDEWLAFPTIAFRGVSDITPIHTVPHKSDALLLGLANIGGALQLCFSLKELLGFEASSAKAPAVYNPMTKPRYLMLERNSQVWVFLADEVMGVFKYDSKLLQNTPSTVTRANPSFVRLIFGFEGRTVGLLDDELVTFALKRSLQ